MALPPAPWGKEVCVNRPSLQKFWLAAFCLEVTQSEQATLAGGQRSGFHCLCWSLGTGIVSKRSPGVIPVQPGLRPPPCVVAVGTQMKPMKPIYPVCSDNKVHYLLLPRLAQNPISPLTLHRNEGSEGVKQRWGLGMKTPGL